MDLKQRNKSLRKWLKQHQLINLSALCRAIQYDRGNFARFMAGNDLGEENISKLEIILAGYGFTK